MDKGIRPYAVAAFIAQAPARVNTREGNTVFRKTLMAELMEQFDITLASAATHYNHAFISAKTTHPALTEGLGRAEDKKGGRKPKAKPEAAAVVAPVADEAVTIGELVFPALNDEAPAAETAQAVEETPAVVITPAAATVGLEELLATQDEVVAAEVDTTRYSVCKFSDKTVVCSDLTLEEANALIEKAAKAKKAKLELVA